MPDTHHTTPGAEVLRDWPNRLRLSAARDSLAQAIYYSRIEAFGLPPTPHWDGLTHEVREHYREVALRTLESVKPEPRGADPAPRSPLFQMAIAITRQHAKVIGAISPDAPYGITEEQS